MGAAVGKIGLDVSELLSEVKKASDALQNMGDSADDAADKANDSVNKQAAAFAVAAKAVDEVVEAIKKAVSVTAELAKNVVDIGADFETAMAQVAATSGMSAKDVSNNIQEYQDLANAAKEAGLSTMFSASEAAEALNYLALAGYSVEESIEYLPSSLTLAAAGAMDLGTASDMVTDAISALNLELEETDSFVDRMAKTAQSSNTNVQQLGRAILTVGGTAQVLAGGVTELDTALGILANNGIKASVGGTSLRQVIVNLTKPTKQASEIIEELGLNIYDAEGNMRPLNEIFGDLNEKMKDFSDKERMNVITHLFDARQLRTANALLKDSGEAWDELYNKIDNADGAAERMAETMRSNLNGALNIAKSNLDAIAITLYEGVQKNITDLVNETIPKFQELNEVLASPEVQSRLQVLSETLKNVALDLLDIAITVAPKIIEFITNLDAHLKSLKIILTAIIVLNIPKFIGTVVTVLKELLAVLVTNPFVAVVTVVAALAVAFTELTTAIENSHKAAVAAAEAENDAWSEQRSEIEGVVEEWEDYKDAAEKARKESIDHADAIKALYQNYKDLHEAGEDTTLAMEALASEVPELQQMLADGTASFETITQSVNEYCNALIRAADLEAAKDTYIQAVKTRSEAERLVQTSKQARDESEQAMRDADRQLKYFEKVVGTNTLFMDKETKAQYDNLKVTAEATRNIYAENVVAYNTAVAAYNEANAAAISSEERYKNAIQQEYIEEGQAAKDRTDAMRLAGKEQAKVAQESSREVADEQQKERDKAANKALADWDSLDKKLKAREITEAEKWAAVGDWFAANPNWDRDNEDLLKQYDKYMSYIEKGEEELRKAKEKAEKEKTEQAKKDAENLEKARTEAVKKSRQKVDNLADDYDWDSTTYAKALKEHLHLNKEYYEQHAEDKEALQREITNLERKGNQERLEENKKTQQEIVDEDLHRIERERKHYNWTEAEYNAALKEHLNTFNGFYDTYADERKKITEKIEDSDWALEAEVKKSAEDYFKTWTDGYDDLISEAQKAYNKLQTDRENFQNKLLNSVELYGTETKRVWDKATHQYKDEEVFAVSSKQLKEQYKSLQEFDKTMESLKRKKVDDDLLNEIWGMDADKAAEYAEALNKMSSGELQAYSNTYEQIKNKTSEMSDKFYKDELEKFEKNYIDPLTQYVQEHSAELSTNMSNIGEDTISGYIEGLEKKSADVNTAMGGYMDSAIQTAKDALGIASPSKEFRQIGENTIQGFIDGIVSKIESIATLFTTLGQTAGENFAAAFKTAWDNFTAMGVTVPTSMITPTFGSTVSTAAGTQTIYNNSYGLTRDDVVSAIQEAMPSGDVILTVDGVQFGRVSRNSLNALAEQQGRLGLMV